MDIKNIRGQAMLEFAIILPLFLFMLFSFMYMAMVMHDYLAMSELTREIARQEAVGKEYKSYKADLGIKERFTSLYTLNSELNKDVVITPVSKDDTLGDCITVQLTINLNKDANVPSLVKSILPEKLNAQLTMRKE